jgi:hypothetical protein
LGPFFFASDHPNTPVSPPILWLLRWVGAVPFFYIYPITTFPLAFILLMQSSGE